MGNLIRNDRRDRDIAWPSQQNWDGHSVDLGKNSLPKSEFQGQIENHYSLEDLDLGYDFPLNGRIFIPPSAFTPGRWTAALVRGLANLEDLYGKTVAEVGVGTGVAAAAFLKLHPEVRELVISDYVEGHADLASYNINLLLGNKEWRYRAIPGSQDLLNWAFNSQSSEDFLNRIVSAPPRPHLVYACIPQVIRPAEVSVSDPEAHYYTVKEGQENEYDQYDLGLVYRLLQQSSKIMATGDRVVLALAGRPTLPLLKDMFRQNKFSSQIVHEEVIEQDPTTCLEHLVKDEQTTDKKFEFFNHRHADTEHLISAGMAETRRKNNLPVYHKLYIIEGTRTET